MLNGYDVVLLASQSLTAAQVTMFTNWVNGGGNLVASRPDKQLAALLGLTQTSLTVSNGYLLINTSNAPGTGLVNADDPVSWHRRRIQRLWRHNGCDALLDLVELHGVAGGDDEHGGTNGGHAAAFTYDLARSVVYTRQGNPAWSGQERDGTTPIRSDDLFFGAKTGDIQPDWIDFSKVAIPQADEQQRLLANMIVTLNASRRPLPRFWYFPRGNKAVVVMTGDDHGFSTVLDRFNQYVAASPAGCNVANWECVRASAYIFPQTPVTDAQLAAFEAQGFEVGLHLTMDPAPAMGAAAPISRPRRWPTTTACASDNSKPHFRAPASPKTHRMHCIMWSDWSTQAQVEFAYGMRLDTSYYYWPPTWINDKPGLFTGSGMPMRVANLDGSMVDVYEAATQITDESGQTYQTHIDTLLDNAVGSAGYYAAVTINMHSDGAPSADNGVIVASAQAHNVPVVSAAQMLTWLDGRNSSVFGPIAWNGTALTFSVAPGAGANGLQVMIPATAGASRCRGSP